MRSTVKTGRLWRFLDVATPLVMEITSVTALRSFTALSKPLVQQWSDQLMPVATNFLSQRALQAESFLAAHLMRTTRVTKPLTVRQIGSPKSKAKACHCEGLSHPRVSSNFEYFSCGTKRNACCKS